MSGAVVCMYYLRQMLFPAALCLQMLLRVASPYALGNDIVLAAQAAFAELLYDVAADFPYEAFPTRA